MRIAAHLLAAAFAGAAVGLAHAGGKAVLPMAADLQRDAVQARHEGKPVVILFSLPECPYCHVVRQNYLAPLLRDPPPAERPIIREIEMTSGRTVVGFDGRKTTHEAIARGLGVRLAPTVAFLDADGRPLTAPVVGGDTAGLYGGVLDNALGQAAQKLSAGASAPSPKH